MKILIYILVFIGGAVLTALSFDIAAHGFQINTQEFCVGAVFIICVLLVTFIILSGFTTVKKNMAALNLPDGSVRAIIALLSIIFFVLLAVIFYFGPQGGDNELPKQILTILGTLVTAVCAFYFGAKATEQGNKIAQDAFKMQTSASALSSSGISLDIIQEAIDANKTNWLTLYGCTDIKAGKKSISNAVQDTNCIVFVVIRKSNNGTAKPIPPTIDYSAKGISYTIPTDVQNVADTSAMDDATADTFMRSAIKDNYTAWKASYPNIVGCTVGIKKTNGALVAVKCIVFKVNGKVSPTALGGTGIIPPTIVYQDVLIPTDVLDTSPATSLSIITQPGDNFTPARIGTSVSRDNSKEFGTVSLKVKIPRPAGVFDSYLLSCFHVLYPERIIPSLFDANLQQTINSTGSDATTLVSIPAKPYLTGNPGSSAVLKADIRIGTISPMMDAAIAQINNPDLIQTTFDNTIITGEADIDTLVVGQPLNVFGCVSGKLNGTVSDLQSERTDVLFSGGGIVFEYTFYQLIEVAVPCQQGDSGAPVLTGDGKLVGIVTAGNGNHSYIIPFPNIKTTLSIQL
jgi:hypothetical protein